VRLAPIALLLLPLAAPAPAAEPIGRLFYTPDQRASLDIARGKRGRTVVATDKTEEAPPPVPTSEVVTYGGMVRRSDGKTTVWLNNRAVTGKASPDAGMIGSIRPDGTVTVQSPQTGRRVELRVGQRAELLSGRIEEGYRQAPASKPEEKSDAAPANSAKEAAAEERRKLERERQENLDDAYRAMRDAAQARAAEPAPQASAPQAPPMVQTVPQGMVVVPAPVQPYNK